MDRLVVVPVEEHQIARREQRACDHLVGGGRAVQHEVGLVRIEDVRRVLLRRVGVALVDEEVPQLHVGIADIRAENIFAENS